MPNLLTYLNQTPMFEWSWLGVDPKTHTNKPCFPRDWTAHSTFVYFELSPQNNWEDMYNSLKKVNITTLLVL